MYDLFQEHPPSENPSRGRLPKPVKIPCPLFQTQPVHGNINLLSSLKKIIRAGFNVPRHIFLNLAKTTTCSFTCIHCSVQISHPTNSSCRAAPLLPLPPAQHSPCPSLVQRKQPLLSTPSEYFGMLPRVLSLFQLVKRDTENT